MAAKRLVGKGNPKCQPDIAKRPVRWGHLCELPRGISVGGSLFKTLPLRLRHLMSWRAAHGQNRGHTPVQKHAHAQGVKPSSNLRINKKVQFVVDNRK